MSSGGELRNSEEHAQTTHQRWIANRYRDPGSPGFDWDKWAGKECMTCRFYIPLMGILGADYGACSNPDSPFDGSVRFEHDGCEAYSENEDYWNDT
jgi:hypothetical protein